jgi:hypothetical protein
VDRRRVVVGAKSSSKKGDLHRSKPAEDFELSLLKAQISNQKAKSTYSRLRKVKKRATLLIDSITQRRRNTRTHTSRPPQAKPIPHPSTIHLFLKLSTRPSSTKPPQSTHLNVQIHHRRPPPSCRRDPDKPLSHTRPTRPRKTTLELAYERMELGNILKRPQKQGRHRDNG